ncbi:U-box domain-containing protein 4 [Phalaenopsis equestris]|uniref:U-box domain-containing protein 4 n=1 Tax=Phalaenopsis equestris TaxID=78828 RepID=UPI0009E35657|nr:U-box domain-containing protein 4 [Phalaenopsis equestris]XP_020574664.1 U-box domain-containing protein 4 [Phalaenopsis equestris]XP_020574665.1 U-box domain-containing protein 4 [Phalaenopsis equestris]
MNPPEKMVGEDATGWDEKVRLFSAVIVCNCERRQSRAIYEFARLSKLAPDSALIDIVPILVNLLSSFYPSIQEAAAFSLRRLARRAGAPFSPIIGQYDAISIILGLLPGSNDRIRRSLLRLLSVLVAFDGTNRVTLAKNRGLDVILELISSCSDNTRKPLLEILSAMVMLREVRRVAISSGALRFLIEAISLGRMTSRIQAAHGIGLLGISKRVRHMLVDSGAIPALLQLFREGDQSAKITAANALGIIASHVDCIRPVAEAGAIPMYMELLEGTEPLGREIAEDVFCVLAVVEENAVVIAEQLVRVLRGCDEEAKSAAVDVFWDIAGYKHSIPVVRDSGAIPVLMEILQHGSADTRVKVMGTISQLAYEEANRTAMAEAGGIPLVINLLTDVSGELRDLAAEALMSFGEDPAFRELIVEAYNIPTFVDAFDRLSVEQLSSDPDFS